MAGLENNIPLLSVIMPVYNAAPYLKLSIESILNQTIKNFEFLIFNDASTDESLAIIKSYADSRIKLVNSNTNKGYLAHLNHGLSIAKGQYIARMDADDISMPERFEQQLAYFQQNKHVHVVGSYICVFSAENESIKTITYPLAPGYIKWHAVVGTPLAHPAVMLKKECLAQLDYFYDEKYYPAEDYDLWVRLLLKGCSIGNIGHTLLKYRAHSQQTSSVKAQLQQANAVEIKKNYIKKLFGVSSASLVEKIYLFFNRPSLLSFSRFYSTAAYLTAKALATKGIDKKSLLLFIKNSAKAKLAKHLNKQASANKTALQQ